MVITTDSDELFAKRKAIVEEMFRQHTVDCHHCMRIGSTLAKDFDPRFCKDCYFCDCVKDGFCELQQKALEFGVDVLPANIELAGAEVELVAAISRETRLKRALEPVEQEYDYIIIDCPPSLGLLTLNSLAAADSVLMPIQCEFYALEGVSQLMNTIELVRTNLNPHLEVEGVLMTMYDGRTRLAEQVVAEVRENFGDLVYETMIPRTVRLSEAPSYGEPILYYDKRSKGTDTYMKLAEEVMAHGK